MLNCFKDYKGNIFTFWFVSWIWLDPSTWNKLWNNNTCCLSNTASDMSADALATLGASASTGMVLTPHLEYSVSNIRRVQLIPFGFWQHFISTQQPCTHTVWIKMFSINTLWLNDAILVIIGSGCSMVSHCKNQSWLVSWALQNKIQQNLNKNIFHARILFWKCCLLNGDHFLNIIQSISEAC